jgi:uncharacterized membrane protein YfcA
MIILIGIIIGLSLGLTGAGGSILAVPLLITILSLEPQQAITLSLAVVGSSATLGVIGHLKSNNIQWVPAIVFSIVGGLFTPIGHWLGSLLPSQVVLFGFSLLVIIVAGRMWLKTIQAPTEASIVRAAIQKTNSHDSLCRINNNRPFKIALPCMLGITAAAIITGLLSGLFGVGGGFIIVPMLIYLLGISIQQAVATSLVIIGVISSIGFFNQVYTASHIDYTLLTTIIFGGVLGMLCGMLLSKYIAGIVLQRLFVIVMLALTLTMIIQHFF